MKKSVYAAVAACFVLCTSVVCAKVHWLPDYVVDGTSKRSHKESDSNIKRTGGKSSDYNCATYNGFLPSEVGSKKCDRRIQLPQGTICYIECCDQCNKTYYNLTSIPANAKDTESCDDICDSATYYKLISCETNYAKNGDTCTECQWGEYTLSQNATVEGAKGYESTTCGGITQKKITGCEEGYNQNGNSCTEKNCQAGYATAVAGCGSLTYGSFTLGSTTNGYAGALACRNCVRNCNTGYTLSGTSCTACVWGDYTLSQNATVTGAKGYEPKTCGGITQKKITGCNNGYTQSGNTCTECQWGDYTLSQNATVTGAKGYEPKTCGGITQKKITGCNNGYTQSGNTCTECQWGDYTLSQNATVEGAKGYESKTCGGITQKKITGCGGGYNQNGNSCTEKNCQAGYATAVAGCGTAPTNGYFTLGSTTNGYAGASACQNCVRNCNPGYTLNGTSCESASCPTGYATAASGCGTAPTNSKYSLGSTTNGSAGGTACKNCTLSCKSGYVNSCSTVANGSNTLTGKDTNNCGTCSLTCNTNYYKSGSSCVPCTWDGYTLTSQNVANASTYDSSTCGGTTKYKLETCNSCYTVSGNTCVEKSCTKTCPEKSTCSAADSCGCVTPTGCSGSYKKSASECGTIDNGKYNIGLADENGCGLCIVLCDDGYARNESSCGVAPDNAYWSVATGTGCKKCVLKCNTGYALSTNNTCEEKVVKPGLGDGGSFDTAIGSNCGQLADACLFLHCASGCVRKISGAGLSACYECYACGSSDALTCPITTGKL